MKSSFDFAKGMGIAALTLGLMVSGPAFAEELCSEGDPPKVTVEPSPIYVSGEPPWSQALTITINLIDNVPAYDTLSVEFDGNLAFSGAKASGGNTICSNKTGGPGTCASGATDNQVVISYTANFSDTGSYPIEVIAEKSGPNDVCETADFVVLMELVGVEFKAPPAIANEFINNDPWYSVLAPKRRGCVISKIAQNHAKISKYGPKGGDGTEYPGTGYDVEKIEFDVIDYFSSVCSK